MNSTIPSAEYLGIAVQYAAPPPENYIRTSKWLATHYLRRHQRTLAASAKTKRRYCTWMQTHRQSLAGQHSRRASDARCLPVKKSICTRPTATAAVRVSPVADQLRFSSLTSSVNMRRKKIAAPATTNRRIKNSNEPERLRLLFAGVGDRRDRRKQKHHPPERAAVSSTNDVTGLEAAG